MLFHSASRFWDPRCRLTKKKKVTATNNQNGSDQTPRWRLPKTMVTLPIIKALKRVTWGLCSLIHTVNGFYLCSCCARLLGSILVRRLQQLIRVTAWRAFTGREKKKVTLQCSNRVTWQIVILQQEVLLSSRVRTVHRAAQCVCVCVGETGASAS